MLEIHNASSIATQQLIHNLKTLMYFKSPIAKASIFYGIFIAVIATPVIADNEITTNALIYPITTDSITAEFEPNDKPKTWYIFSFENDAFGVLNTNDDGYSNGVAFSWGYAPIKSFESIDMPDWIRFLSKNTYINKGDSKNYSIGYGISQSMFTPQDLHNADLIVDDRPYAGTLVWNAKIRNYSNNVADSIGLSLGVVGPASRAEQTQIRIHEAIGSEIPQGWDNQLENEPVFRIEAEHIIRFADFNLSNTTAFDTSLYSQAGIGNLLSDAGAGLTFRLGNQLDQNYAYINPAPARSGNAIIAPHSAGYNWQVFLSVYARYVLNDITLDGNTFKDSHSVELINEQGLVSLGFSLNWKNWGFLFSTQTGTNKFEGQKSKSSFGAISLSYHH